MNSERTGSLDNRNSFKREKTKDKMEETIDKNHQQVLLKKEEKKEKRVSREHTHKEN